MSSTNFDIHAKLLTEEGDFDDAAVETYRDQLFELFEDSPEGRALATEGIRLGFAWSIVDYLLRFEDVSPAAMTDIQFETIVFEIVPEKVSADPKEARAMILEARAFCRYLARAHGLETALAALAIVERDDAIETLEAALSDPENWGMAKSIVMHGMAKGYDLTSQEGADKYLAAYNATLLPSISQRTRLAPMVANRKADPARRKKRKQQKAARRKNR